MMREQRPIPVYLSLVTLPVLLLALGVLGYLAFLGLFVHSFFDGVSIASGFAVSHALGLLVFSAVLLHKVPEGFTIASIMLAAGAGRARAGVRLGAKALEV